MERVLRLFSYVFHPLFIAVYAVLLYFIYGARTFEYADVYLLTLQLVIITILIPVTFYYLLLSLGKVDSIMLSQTAQRRMPLIIHAVLLMILLRRTVTLSDYPELHFYFLGCLVSTVTALLLVFLGIKASLHMIGISSLTVFAVAISLHGQERLIALVFVLLLCNGLVATSRLAMKAHSQTELALGTGIGIIPQLALLYFWL